MAKPIGALLEEEGIVSEDMIAYALKVQTATGERLGDTLLRLKFVTDSEIARVLARQANLPFNDLLGLTPDVEVLQQLPYNFARRNEMLPVAVVEGRLRVAIADPFAEQGLSRLNRFTTLAYDLMVAPRGRLLGEIERLYYLAEHPLAQEVEAIAGDAQAGRPFRTDRLLELLTSTAIELGASDMHITATSFATLVAYRVDGVLQLRYSLPPAMHPRIIAAYKVEAGMDVAELHRPQDGHMRFDLLHRAYDLRISTLPTVDGENLVVRILSGENDIRGLDDLGFTADQRQRMSRLAASPYGMVLVAGPTGSGKSTTLYGLLRRINAMQKNVLTIEDPVEFDMPLARQVAVNEKAGITFASAIRSFLRQDPDVMLIGEVRDEETAALASRAAQTGHLVLSTLHTNDAVGAVARLRDLGVPSFLLASVLGGVIAQRLVRRLCPSCKRQTEVGGDEAQRYGLASNRVYRHAGCPRCHDTGYVGRIAIAEIFEVDDDIRAMIDTDASPLAIARKARDNGMTSLLESASALIAAGMTDIDEVERVVRRDARTKERE